MVVTTTSTTAGNISFTGSAAAHANLNDVTNVTLTFTNAAFTGASATGVVGYLKNNITLDYVDQSITYSGAGFAETAVNGGAVTGSRSNHRWCDFRKSWRHPHCGHECDTLKCPCWSRTPVLTVNGAGTTVTLTFTGASALTHTNAVDVTNITFVFADSAFAGGALATNITNATGPAASNIGINFIDVTLTYVGTTFTESVTNNGTIPFTNTSLLSLAGDTFFNQLETTQRVSTSRPISQPWLLVLG